jgi:hypothetical protein
MVLCRCLASNVGGGAALLQTPVANLWVTAAEPDQVTGEITIHLNRAPARPVNVAWFIVN